MSSKWIGAFLIIGSCTSFGFSIALQQLRETHLLSALCIILEDMQNELSFHLTPLADLLRHASSKAPCTLQTIFQSFADNLDHQTLPDASSCMDDAMMSLNPSYTHLRTVLISLGNSLGRFDLAGQINGLAMVQEQCRQELLLVKSDQNNQIKSYRILGICAGLALTIFLL